MVFGHIESLFDGLRPSRRSVVLGREDILLGQDHILLGQEHILLGQEHVLLGQEHILLGQEETQHRFCFLFCFRCKQKRSGKHCLGRALWEVIRDRFGLGGRFEAE